MVRVLVVEDNAGLRRALVDLLEEQPNLEVVSKAGPLAEARMLLEGVDIVLLHMDGLARMALSSSGSSGQGYAALRTSP